MGFPSSDSFSVIFTIAISIIGIGFVFVFGTIIARAIQNGKQWKRNNDSPVLSVPATIVAKRADVSIHHHNSGVNNMSNTTSSTTYYATFQVESGDRMELILSDLEHGILVEGDAGKLTFQGTRYKGFERIK